jgi:hypothetical protein
MVGLPTNGSDNGQEDQYVTKCELYKGILPNVNDYVYCIAENGVSTAGWVLDKAMNNQVTQISAAEWGIALGEAAKWGGVFAPIAAIVCAVEIVAGCLARNSNRIFKGFAGAWLAWPTTVMALLIFGRLIAIGDWLSSQALYSGIASFEGVLDAALGVGASVGAGAILGASIAASMVATVGTGGAAILVVVIMAAFALLGIFLLTIVMGLVTYGQMVAAVFAPIGVMLIGYEPTRKWAKMWATSAVTLVLTKPILSGIIALNLKLIANGDDSWLTGTVGMLLAVAAPGAVFKMVGFTGEHLAGAAKAGLGATQKALAGAADSLGKTMGEAHKDRVALDAQAGDLLAGKTSSKDASSGKSKSITGAKEGEKGGSSGSEAGWSDEDKQDVAAAQTVEESARRDLHKEGAAAGEDAASSHGVKEAEARHQDASKQTQAAKAAANTTDGQGKAAIKESAGEHRQTSANLADAKDAYRKNPTPENLANVNKAKAVHEAAGKKLDAAMASAEASGFDRSGINKAAAAHTDAVNALYDGGQPGDTAGADMGAVTEAARAYGQTQADVAGAEANYAQNPSDENRDLLSDAQDRQAVAGANLDATAGIPAGDSGGDVSSRRDQVAAAAIAHSDATQNLADAQAAHRDNPTPETEAALAQATQNHAATKQNLDRAMGRQQPTPPLSDKTGAAAAKAAAAKQAAESSVSAAKAARDANPGLEENRTQARQAPNAAKAVGEAAAAVNALHATASNPTSTPAQQLAAAQTAYSSATKATEATGAAVQVAQTAHNASGGARGSSAHTREALQQAETAHTLAGELQAEVGAALNQAHQSESLAANCQDAGLQLDAHMAAATAPEWRRDAVLDAAEQHTTTGEPRQQAAAGLAAARTRYDAAPSADTKTALELCEARFTEADQAHSEARTALTGQVQAARQGPQRPKNMREARFQVAQTMPGIQGSSFSGNNGVGGRMGSHYFITKRLLGVNAANNEQRVRNWGEDKTTAAGVWIKDGVKNTASKVSNQFSGGKR